MNDAESEYLKTMFATTNINVPKGVEKHFYDLLLQKRLYDGKPL